MTDLSIDQMQLIAHSLGIDLLNAVVSSKKKDKVLPKDYSRNYFCSNKRNSNWEQLQMMVDDKFMYTRSGAAGYFYVTNLGKSKFETDFQNLVKWEKPDTFDLEYLKERINAVCEIYHFTLNADYIIDKYVNCLKKAFYISSSTNVVIRTLRTDLDRYYKAGLFNGY